MHDLRHVDAVITGGTSGIGLELARQLAALGARPLIIGRSEARLDAALADAPGLRGLVGDVRSPDLADRIRAELAEHGGRLRLLVNNAGVQHANEAGDDAWHLPGGDEQEIAINVQGLVRLSYALLPDLAAHGPAALVNVSSGLALAPKASSPIYCATKAFVRSFTRGLRYRVQDAGLPVHVMEALPPLVDTPMTAGRGRDKLSPQATAAALLSDLRAGRSESRIGKVRLLAAIQRASPALAYRIMRGA